MKARSKKGQALDRAYKKAKIERAEELKADGNWVCFFTGEPLPDDIPADKMPVHHLKGKDGDLYTDKKFFAFYKHGECHSAIHDKPMSFLIKQAWWRVYMNHLKALDEDLWCYWRIREEQS